MSKYINFIISFLCMALHFAFHKVAAVPVPEGPAILGTVSTRCKSALKNVVKMLQLLQKQVKQLQKQPEFQQPDFQEQPERFITQLKKIAIESVKRSALFIGGIGLSSLIITAMYNLPRINYYSRSDLFDWLSMSSLFCVGIVMGVRALMPSYLMTSID